VSVCSTSLTAACACCLLTVPSASEINRIEVTLERVPHLARFIVSLVTEELDLTEITASYLGEKGQPPFHPEPRGR
jgi:hypothetical protein